jgi:hypothetical protein
MLLIMADTLEEYLRYEDLQQSKKDSKRAITIAKISILIAIIIGLTQIFLNLYKSESMSYKRYKHHDPAAMQTPYATYCVTVVSSQ